MSDAAPVATLYLYGLMRAGVPLPAESGMLDRPITAVSEGALQAIVTAFDPQWIAAALHESDGQMPALETLAPMIFTHDRVVRVLFASGAILPAGFATLITDEHTLRALLHDHQAEWLTFLDKIDGCVEMGIKAYADISALMSSVQSLTDSGGSYLVRRKAEMDAKNRADKLLTGTLNALHQACSLMAREALLKPVEAGDDLTHALQMRGVYLVERGDAAAFINCFADIEDTADWLEVHVDGPFAPYHFVGQVGS